MHGEHCMVHYSSCAKYVCLYAKESIAKNPLPVHIVYLDMIGAFYASTIFTIAGCMKYFY